MLLEAHRDLYRSLSKFDKDLLDNSVSTAERLRFWKFLDTGDARKLLAKLGYPEHEADGLLKDIHACRELRKRKDPVFTVSENIYELMLLLTEFWVERPDYIYRGHGDYTWEIIPSWYRAPFDRDVQLYETAMNSRYRRIEKKQIGKRLDLSAFEREAIVQHYGSSTLLVDFSASIRVACFFGTFTIDNPMGQLGRLYILNTTHLKEHGLTLLRAAQIPMDFRRIHLTKGCFLQSWARGVDFDTGAYHARISGDNATDRMHFAGKVDLQDPNRYLLAVRLIESKCMLEFVFKQEGGSFQDPRWRVSQSELDY
jgi:hypothetical protein